MNGVETAEIAGYFEFFRLPKNRARDLLLL